MKMYLPFGDWSDDGHGKYEKYLIEAPSMEHLLVAQIKIKTKYGYDFFRHMANDYDNSSFGKEVWQALIDTNYPVERMREKEDVNTWDKCKSIQEVLELDSNPYLSLDFIVDAFIWLLNAHGAEIKVLDEHDSIPMICNWTCPGFETIGYGCFY